MPQVSVIVPVYNVEEYLNRCVDSILNQTFQDFELILVDDGSTDNTGKICDIYAQEDKRVRVIHKENAGVSVARNLGVKIAKGNFISFVDGDDYIEKQYIHKLLFPLLETNANINIADLIRKENFEQSKKFWNHEYKCISSNEAIVELGKNSDALNAKFRSSMAKMVKKELVEKFPFPIERKYAEDMAVVYKWIWHAQKVVILNDGIYYYTINNTSVSREGWNEKKLGNLKTLKEMLLFFKEQKLWLLYDEWLPEYILNLCYQYREAQKANITYNILRRMKKEMLKILLKNVRYKKITLKRYPDMFNILFPNSMYIFWTICGLKKHFRFRRR